MMVPKVNNLVMVLSFEECRDLVIRFNDLQLVIRADGIDKYTFRNARVPQKSSKVSRSSQNGQK